MSESVIEIKGLKNNLGGQWVHTDVNLDVKRGEILAIIGGSGSGKTTILRSLLMLLKPTAGNIKIFGQDISNLDMQQSFSLRRRWGMLFQHSALFSSMTVLENIMFPMREFTNLDPELLFLDEPTTGLDPLSARRFDELIVFLRDSLKLTIVMVSHDIESLKRTTDRVAFLGDGKVLSVAPINELMKNTNQKIADYFSKV
jgi:phospholipid/cholesterol/gamma-HCH transport system ATP-binding protein